MIVKNHTVISRLLINGLTNYSSVDGHMENFPEYVRVCAQMHWTGPAYQAE